MKLVIITCYHEPDYVRSLSLRAALTQNNSLELIVIKNKHRGLLRYPEVLLRTFWVRIRQQPDVYLLTFRGQELLPFMLLLTWHKPLIFDEFIVPLAWATQEKHRLTATIRLQRLLARVSAPFYKAWLSRCRLILTDTEAHADASSELSGVDRARYRSLPVGAEELLFKPAPGISIYNKPYEVFFCGNMRPLYGLQFVLEAAMILKDQEGIHFYIVGGQAADARKVELAIAKGANIDYKPWVKFETLPKLINESDICLAGPFGATPQAQQVITGKTYQYLACAVPTVIGVNQATDAFSDKRDCLLVPQADAEAVASAILWAHKHPHELAKIGEAGHALYHQKFGIDAIARQLRIILNEVT